MCFELTETVATKFTSVILLYSSAISFHFLYSGTITLLYSRFKKPQECLVFFRVLSPGIASLTAANLTYDFLQHNEQRFKVSLLLLLLILLLVVEVVVLS